MRRTRTAIVNAMIAATAARPPRTGVMIPVNPETRWYAASTGTPKRLNMRQRPSSYDGMRAGGGREVRGSAPAGQQEMAAAWAADGALGLDRPAASGSRWRKNAASQDFSRSAEARRIIGRVAVVRDTLATEVSRASTAANMAPARTAPASAVRPDGLTASWVRSRSSPASMVSRLLSTVIAIVPSWGP